MKRLLLSVLLLSALFANAQITLLHTFEEDGVTVYSPTIVEDVGVYCYITDSTDENNIHHYPTYYYFDSEFNLYWSHQFEVGRYAGVSLFPTRHLIDADNRLEFIVNESERMASGFSRVHSYIMEEDGTIIYDFDNAKEQVVGSSFEFIVKNGRYPFSENGDIRSLLSVQN